MKKNPNRFVAFCAAVASLGLAVMGITAFQAVETAEPAHAAAGPFTCTSDFYQVSGGNMYQYSVSTATYTVMSGNSNVSGLNAIGYNTADNYIYGIASGKLYKIANDGSHTAGVTLTGVTAQSTGGDFIAANQLLTASNSGAWTDVNVSTGVVSSFTESGSTWAAYDFAYNPTNSTGYGMSGTTVYIGKVSGTTVTVSSKPVTGLPSTTKTSDAWGAAYVDSAGDAYFFDNTTDYLVEVSASSLASGSPTAVQITQANSLTTPNDGASCPTASSPLAPTVVTGSATSVTTSGAVLNGTVATGLPTGSDVPSGGIEICYSTSNTLVNGALSVSPVCAATTPSSLPVNTAATAVSLTVTGLSAGTTYYYQLEATNSFGLEAFGSVATLNTVAANHTVTFNNNGGSGTMASETNNAATALTTNTFTRAGYTFGGWNTASNGTGTSYADGASYPFTADATLYAQWTAIPNSTVTFNNNGGSGTMTAESANVPTALTTNSFTRAGYTFSGWNTAAGGTGTAYADGATYPFASNTTLYAQWTAIPNSTVTFNANSGSGSMSNESANVPTALSTNAFTRAGYTFSGWNTAANGSGTAYANGATYAFSSNATMYAQWTAIPNSTVTFNNNGGSGTMTAESNNVPTALTTNTFTRAGYTFAGWNTAANGSGTTYVDGATYPFSSSATLYAQWTAIPTQTVSFNNNGGSGTMSAEIENVPTALTLNTFTRAGYTFGGWNTAANGTGTAYADGATYGFTASATMYAQWTAIPNSTVTFNSNGGSGSMTAESANVPTGLTANAFTRAGYTFGGWNTAANGTGTAYSDGASFPFSSSTTLYAQWTAIPNSTVTFNNNGGSGSMTAESNNVPTALTTNSFTRAGYTFAGWNTASDGSGSAYSDGATYAFASNATMYAQWTVIPNSTVAFNNNGGSGSMADESHNVATALTTNTFTRLGYTFAGWNTASNGTGTSYGDGASYPFTSNATMYAQWTAIPNSTVVFNNNGGSGAMSNESTNVPTALTTNSFTRAGYTFAGWNTAANGTGTAYADGATYAFAADATMFAQWNLIPNSIVSFYDNGGSGTMSDEAHNVPTALDANTFTRSGYTFAGWNTAANGTGTAYADGAIYAFDADASMFAQWTAIPNSTVSFDNNGGSGSMSDQADNVPTALDANTFTRAGYTFSGWNTASDGSGTSYPDASTYPFSSDATLYAQWTAIPNSTVVFDGNGGSGSMPNETTNVPTALSTNTFTHAGYTFAGWNTASNGTGTTYADGATYPFSSSTALYAQWTAIPNSTVVFDSNGGSGSMADESHNVPTDLTSNTFTRLGYDFAGWNTAADGTGSSYSDGASYAFSADATMYAQWTVAPNHTVTFDDNGGMGTMGSQAANVPTDLDPNTITRAGFTFAGWNTASDGSGTGYGDAASYPFAADATLYAQWNAIPDSTVTFDANGGNGSMAAEQANVPTALTANTFTRVGYNFEGWNTVANGTGTSYANVASYSFSTNATMFAQWGLIPVLTFDGNGGTGTAAPVSSDNPTTIPMTVPKRTGYKFTGWNTAADGSGTEYAPGGTYPMTSSGVLYAQWVKIVLATTGVNPTPGIQLGILLIVAGLVLMAPLGAFTRRRRHRA